MTFRMEIPGGYFSVYRALLQPYILNFLLTGKIVKGVLNVTGD